jgi:hypothetical protein
LTRFPASQSMPLNCILHTQMYAQMSTKKRQKAALEV